MRTKLVVVAALAVAAVTLTAVASAGSTTTKQRVTIQHIGAGFVLTPLTSGPIKFDKGPIDFCCWTNRPTIKNGQEVDIDNPQMTLTGKHGTIVAQNVIGYVNVPDGWAVFTGTWRVIRGTGAYARLTGGGGAAGVALANGTTKAQFEGFLSLK